MGATSVHKWQETSCIYISCFKLEYMGDENNKALDKNVEAMKFGDETSTNWFEAI